MAKAQASSRDAEFLVTWRRRQRTANLSDEQRAALAGLDPHWCESRQSPWDGRLEEARRIVESLGRFPKNTDSDPGAVSAFRWIRRQLELPASHPRRLALTEALPGWDASYDAQWNQKLALAVEYVAVNGSLPPQREATCGSWLSLQKRKASTPRRAVLDEHLPGWDRSASDRWEDALTFVAHYHARHGRFPSSTSKDPEVRFHGAWLVFQRRPQGSTPARTKALDARIPGWRDSRDMGQWESRLNDYLTFIDTEGRRPSLAAGASPSEHRLARWINNQRVSKDLERTAILDAKLPGWRGNRLGETGKPFRTHDLT